MDPLSTSSVSKGAQPSGKAAGAPKKDEGQVNIKVPPQGALTSKNAALNNNGALKPDRNIKVDLNINGNAPSATKSTSVPKEQPKKDVPLSAKEAPKPAITPDNSMKSSSQASKPPIKPIPVPSQQTSKPVLPVSEPPKPVSSSAFTNSVVSQPSKPNSPSGLINPAISEAPKPSFQSTANNIPTNDIPRPGNGNPNSYKLAATEVQGPKGPLVENSGRKLFFVMAAIAVIGVLAIGGYLLMGKSDTSPALVSVSPTPTPKPTIDPTLDTDNDGIPDKVEKAIGTNSGKMDSDNDSYNDLPELKSGYSPIVAGSDGKYTPEQFQTLKDKIKSTDEKFYEKTFGIPSPTPSSVDETVNWQIRKEEKYGFEVKYPQDWRFKTQAGEGDFIITDSEEESEQKSISIAVFLTSDDNFKSMFGINNNLDDVKSNKDKLLLGDSKIVGETLIDKQAALKYRFEFAGNMHEGYFVIKDGLFYNLSYQLDKKTELPFVPVINQIISTFKFTEKVGN